MKMLLLLASLMASKVTASNPERLNAQAVEDYRMGRFQQAEGGFRAALEGWVHANPASAKERALAGVNLGAVLMVEGRYAEAESVLTEFIGTLQMLDGQDSPDAARATYSLAALYQEVGRHADAERLGRGALAGLARGPHAGASGRGQG